MTDWDALRPKPPVKQSGKSMSGNSATGLDQLAKKYGVLTEGAAIVAIDRSGSMSLANKLSGAKAGAIDFARAATGYRLGVISFGSDATLHSPLTMDRATFERAVGDIDIEGSTDMAGALSLADEQLPAVPGQYQVVVLVTDGAPDDKGTALEAANRLKSRGVVITIIGTKDADWAFLRLLASSPTGAHSVDPQQLRIAIASAAKSLPRVTGR